MARPPTKPAPPFGARLAQLRKGRGLTQSQFADLVGATRSNIDYYERRASNPTLEFIRRCAQALGVTVADLVGEPPAAPARRRGPKSKLEQRFERVRSLPKREQDLAVEMLDRIIDAHGKAG